LRGRYFVSQSCYSRLTKERSQESWDEVWWKDQEVWIRGTVCLIFDKAESSTFPPPPFRGGGKEGCDVLGSIAGLNAILAYFGVE